MPMLSTRAFHRDREAFAAEVPKICRAALRSIEVDLGEEGVQDAAAMAVAILWQKRRRFKRSTGTVGNFCQMVALRQGYDMLRKRGRENRKLANFFKIQQMRGLLPEIDAQNETVTP